VNIVQNSGESEDSVATTTITRDGMDGTKVCLFVLEDGYMQREMMLGEVRQRDLVDLGEALQRHACLKWGRDRL
jgi:hypothetical protein